MNAIPPVTRLLKIKTSFVCDEYLIIPSVQWLQSFLNSIAGKLSLSDDVIEYVEREAIIMLVSNYGTPSVTSSARHPVVI